MQRFLNDSAHWRALSQEARLLAKQLDDPEAKSAALEIAYQYGRIANRAERPKKDRARKRDR